MKKKKRKIRKGRVVVALTVLAVLVAFIVYFGYLLVRFGIDSIWGDKDNDSKDSITEVEVTPEMEEQSKAMVCVIDSFMAIPQLLDSSNIAISVFDATIQRQIYSYHDHQSLAPASCMKIATAIASVKTLGLSYRFRESLQARGTMHGDTLIGSLLLHADDDPMVYSIDSLVKRLPRHGIRHIRGDVYISLAREDTLRPHPSAKVWDIAYHKSPLLMKGRRYIHRNLMATLRINGITFKRDVSVRPTGKYRCIAADSHSLRDIIAQMMIHSSNIKAETMLYHLDWLAGLAPDRSVHWDIEHQLEHVMRFIFCADSTRLAAIPRQLPGGATKASLIYADARADAMQGFVINDGSGLSPGNRLSAQFLVEMLRYAYNDKVLHDYFINEALATPDDGIRRGSLLSRMQQPEYRGRIFVKTGTLTTIGGSSLAGYLRGRDNHWYIFAIINSDSPVAESRIFQDRLCKMMMK